MFEHAYGSIINGVEDVENRVQPAADESLVNREETLLILTDLGIDAYLPVDDSLVMLRDALGEERDKDQEQLTLYDTYNAATRR